MKGYLPDSQGVAIVALFTLGSSSIFNLGARANNDIWLAFLLAIVPSFPFILMYARLKALMPETTLTLGLESLYGPVISRILAVLYSTYTWHTACLVGKDASTFIRGVALESTPEVVLLLCFAVLIIWAIKAGQEPVGRWSAISLKIVLFVIALILIPLLTRVDTSEFLPVLYRGWQPVLFGALEMVDVPLLELVIVLWALEKVHDKKSPYKIFLYGFFLSSFVLMLMSTISMLVIGPDKYGTTYFPIYLAVSRISLFRFLTRLEATVGVTFIVTCFLKMTICLFVSCQGIAHVFDIEDYRFLATPIVLAVIPGSQWFAKSTMDILRGATKVFGPYDFIMQAIIPLLIWFSAEILTRRSSIAKLGQ